MQNPNDNYILRLKRKWWYLAWFCFVLPVIILPALLITLCILLPDAILILILAFGIPLGACIIIFCETSSVVRKKLISLGSDVTLRFPKK